MKKSSFPALVWQDGYEKVYADSKGRKRIICFYKYGYPYNFEWRVMDKKTGTGIPIYAETLKKAENELKENIDYYLGVLFFNEEKNTEIYKLCVEATEILNEIRRLQKMNKIINKIVDAIEWAIIALAIIGVFAFIGFSFTANMWAYGFYVKALAVSILCTVPLLAGLLHESLEKTR